MSTVPIIIPNPDQSLIGVHGWLMFFCVTLGLESAGSLFRGVPLMLSIHGWDLIGGLLFIGLAIYGVMVIVKFQQRKKIAIRSAYYFMGRSALFGLFTTLNDSKTNDGIEMYAFVVNRVFYGAIWYAYLSKSKRVQATLTQ